MIPQIKRTNAKKNHTNKMVSCKSGEFHKGHYAAFSLIIVLLTIQPCFSKTDDEEQFEKIYEQAVQFLHESKIAEALSLGEQGLLLARRMGDGLKEAEALSLIGNAYFYQDRYAEALSNFKSVLFIVRRLGDEHRLATALKDIGITYQRLGQIDEGFEPLYESLKISRQINDSATVASALENIGMAYANLGAYHLAFEMYEQALNAAQQTGKPQSIFGALIRIGTLYHNLYDDERASDYLQRALAIAEQQKLSPLDQAWAMMELSVAVGELGQMDAAVEFRRRSLSICEQLGWESGLGDNYQGLGELYLYLDYNPVLALRYFERSCDFYKQAGHNSRCSYASMAEAHRMLGDLDRAVEYYERAIAIVESIRGQLSLEQHRATFLSKHQKVYQAMIETLIERHDRDPENNDHLRAFAVYERGKARALLEAIAAARIDIKQELDPGLRRRETELEARIGDLQKRLAASDLAARERGRLIERLDQAEQEMDQLLGDIKRQDRRYAAVRYPEPFSADQARAVLDEKTAILAYSVTGHSVFVFLLTGDSFVAERLRVSPAVLTARVQNYVDLIAGGDRSNWQEAGARLYGELIEPLRSRLGSRINQLVIIPDGVLHYLPFETLRVIDRSGEESNPQARFLLQDFAISYAPSATILSELTATARPPLADRADVLMFAHPSTHERKQDQPVPPDAREYARVLYEDEGLAVTPIPFTGTEAEEVRRYAGSGSQVYVGRQASERQIKASRLDGFHIIHFATHALISQRKPERSALVLAAAEGDAEDGFLQAREIYRLKLAENLLILSACETARGQLLDGEGTQGLTQAFFYAGAQSVVASLWKVDDEETARFMAAFYDHLAQAKSKGEALRAAKLEMIGKGSTASVHHWASFILIGEAASSVPIKDQSWAPRFFGWKPVTAFVLIGLTVLVVFKWRNFTSEAVARP